jgi:hypothetical protein
MASSTPDDPFRSQYGRPRGVVTQPPPTTKTVRPHVWEFVLHPLKALRFLGALARDPRISALRKIVFVAVVGAFVGALLVPDGVIAVLVATLLPIVGPVVALPADATVDWLFIGTVAYALLGLFPAYIVREHHARIFHPRRTR